MTTYDDDDFEFKKEWQESTENGETNLSLPAYDEMRCIEDYGPCADELDSGDN